MSPRKLVDWSSLPIPTDGTYLKIGAVIHFGLTTTMQHLSNHLACGELNYFVIPGLPDEKVRLELWQRGLAALKYLSELGAKLVFDQNVSLAILKDVAITILPFLFAIQDRNEKAAQVYRAAADKIANDWITPEGLALNDQQEREQYLEACRDLANAYEQANTPLTSEILETLNLVRLADRLPPTKADEGPNIQSKPQPKSED